MKVSVSTAVSASTTCGNFTYSTTVYPTTTFIPLDINTVWYGQGYELSYTNEGRHTTVANLDYRNVASNLSKVIEDMTVKHQLEISMLNMRIQELEDSLRQAMKNEAINEEVVTKFIEEYFNDAT